MYCNALNPKLKLLLKNYRLSDDIAFRFSEQGWSEWPLTTAKFVDWLNVIDKKDEVVNLFMDYETFGEHQWEETGIFGFLKTLPGRVFANSDYEFNIPAELGAKLQPVSAIHVPHPISWADEERDLTAWLGNPLQDDAFDGIYALEEKVKSVDDFDIVKDWRYMQSSDHFYYMCTKWFSDGDVHEYFNPFPSPYEAYINYMNVLADFTIRVDEAYKSRRKTLRKSDKRPTTDTVKDHGKASLKFNDLAKLSDTRLKLFLRKTDLQNFACAMIGSKKSLRDKVVRNLGKRNLLKFEDYNIGFLKIGKDKISDAKKMVEESMNELI